MAGSDQIIKTIKYALDKAQKNNDYTFKSIIKSVNTDGTYTIKDQSGIDRKIKSGISGLELKPGKMVWVKVPSGNIKDMHICGITKDAINYLGSTTTVAVDTTLTKDGVPADSATVGRRFNTVDNDIESIRESIGTTTMEAMTAQDILNICVI